MNVFILVVISIAVLRKTIFLVNSDDDRDAFAHFIGLCLYTLALIFQCYNL